MLLTPEQLVEQIHDAPTRIVLAATGGGSRAIADLLEVPGGSRTLLEAAVPYSAAAMAAWLGGPPDEACSAATARAMAMAAFLRAVRYEEEEKGVRTVSSAPEEEIVPTPFSMPFSTAGVACTASLASDRPKRGPHRIHVALQTAATTAARHLELHKGRRSRAEEERLAGHLVLNVIAEAKGLSAQLALELLEGEHVEASRTDAPKAWQQLLLGKCESVTIGPVANSPRCLFPGSFNPRHAGHARMIEIASKMLGERAAVEISIVNVDKPPLDYAEIECRLAQFPPDQPVHLTRAATFDEKSRLFPGATFVVGADTLRRIASPDYHGGDANVHAATIERIAARGCRFLVFARDSGAGLVRLADLDLPNALRRLCREVPPEVFREDVSSSAIRREETER
jgi:hypothetical protein